MAISHYDSIAVNYFDRFGSESSLAARQLSEEKKIDNSHA